MFVVLFVPGLILIVALRFRIPAELVRLFLNVAARETLARAVHGKGSTAGGQHYAES
jgi:hypothetical protein